MLTRAQRRLNSEKAKRKQISIAEIFSLEIFNPGKLRKTKISDCAYYNQLLGANPRKLYKSEDFKLKKKELIEQQEKIDPEILFLEDEREVEQQHFYKMSPQFCY